MRRLLITLAVLRFFYLQQENDLGNDILDGEGLLLVL